MFGCWVGIKMFLHEKGACQNDMKTVSLQFCGFCLMDRYRTCCFAQWTGTGMFAFGSWQGTAGSQRLELTVANVGTIGYHCKELPVPRGWNSWFPTWEPEFTIASNCRLPEVGTHASQRGNHRLPLQRTSSS